MDIVLTESQQMLKQSAHALLQEMCPVDVVREMQTGRARLPTRAVAAHGRFGLAGLALSVASRRLSEGDFFDLALLVEELGYAAAPTPFFSSIIEAGLLLIEAGTTAQKRALVPRLASGEALFAVAYLEADGDPTGPSHATTATAQGADFMLSGNKCFVPAAHVAEQLLCVARTRPGSSATRGLSLFCLPPDDASIHLRQMTTVPGDKQYEVTYAKTPVAHDALIGRLHGAGLPLQRALLRATALKCAEMVGGAQATLDLTWIMPGNASSLAVPLVPSKRCSTTARICTAILKWGACWPTTPAGCCREVRMPRQRFHRPSSS